MKISMSRTTILNINLQAEDVVEQLSGKRLNLSKSFLDVARTDYANVSISTIGDEYVMEVNDELFFKYMSVYLKIARVVGPFITPIKNLICAVNNDMKDIERFLNQRKSTHTEDVAAWDEARRAVDKELAK